MKHIFILIFTARLHLSGIGKVGNSFQEHPGHQASLVGLITLTKTGNGINEPQ